MSTNLARVPIFMRDLADVAARVLIDELGLPAERAAEVGLRMARDACAEHAGEMIYIPAGSALNIDDRDRALYAFYIAHDRDINQVAREFHLSVQTAYKRIRFVEASLQADLQGALFESSAD